MDFDLTKEHEMLRRSIREFAEKEIKPIAAQIDQECDIPRDLFTRMGEVNLMGMTV
ncbi:MAG: acyl-CoA dehydrogenase family protein, partial [Thermoplasmata archaeon]|nr:acyl-CoA dehydrogenase family protein [Thermoplasmata archaeon]